MFHVSFASVPIVAPLAIHKYFQPGRAWEPQPAEFLFFTFMISSIACGEVAEWMYHEKFKKRRALLLASFAVGAVWSVILFAISLHHNIGKGSVNGIVKCTVTGIVKCTNGIVEGPVDGIVKATVDADPTLLVHSMVMAGAFLTLGTLVEWRLDDVSKSWRQSF